MSLLRRLFGGKTTAKEYPTDEININGKSLRLRFFAHASVAIEYENRWIYVDPVMENADYSTLPKADIILVTHHHFDHFDMAAIEALQKEDTRLLLDKTSAEGLGGDCYTMLPKGVAEPIECIKVEAVAAYNTSEGHTDFHPKH
ncbi:MAG: MBL fold metallo-hydrolase, partial [Alistipes sp.]|nr:MBL fold metallo-hydrolase [Alistipes sp.]